MKRKWTNTENKIRKVKKNMKKMERTKNRNFEVI